MIGLITAYPRLFAIGVALLFCLGVFGTLKYQSYKIDSLKEELAEKSAALDSAIEQHNALVDDVNNQRKVAKEREDQRDARDKENRALKSRISKLIQENKDKEAEWASATLPNSIFRELQNLPSYSDVLAAKRTVPTPNSTPSDPK